MSFITCFTDLVLLRRENEGGWGEPQEHSRNKKYR